MGRIFFEILAVHDSIDSRLSRPEKRDQESQDESAAKDPNGPVITSAEEPRLEKVTIEKDAHAGQDADASRRRRRAFFRGQKRREGNRGYGGAGGGGGVGGGEESGGGVGSHRCSVGDHPGIFIHGRNGGGCGGGRCGGGRGGGCRSSGGRGSAINVVELDVVLIAIEGVHGRHEVNEDVDAQNDEHQQEGEKQQCLRTRSLRLDLGEEGRKCI